MSKFYPEIYQKNIYTINYKKLKNKNIKCLLFDLDNTCIPYKDITIPKKLNDLFNKLNKMNFKVIIFSNSNKKRLKKLNLSNIEYNASSKKPLRYNFNKIIKKYNYKKDEICIIGDQLLTDILGGNTTGIHTCLVEPLSNQELLFTKISRKIEKIIIKKLSKHNKFTKGEYYD